MVTREMNCSPLCVSTKRDDSEPRSPTARIVYGGAMPIRLTSIASPEVRMPLAAVSRWPLTAIASAPASQSPLARSAMSLSRTWWSSSAYCWC